MNDTIQPRIIDADAKALLRSEVFDWFERDDGLPALGFRIDSPQGLAREVDWHTHRRGQLICVERGLLTTRTRHGTWSLPPGSAGWMPPQELHTVQIDGPLLGWGVTLTAAVSQTLPAEPCVIAINPLLRAVALRVCEWPPALVASARQQHVTAVLLDEIAQAPRQRMHLPMPRDRRLLKIAAQVIADPADDRQLADWAAWAGLSARTLSRHFRQETTLSFAQWRQQARLAEALRRLAEGHPVADIAHTLGFSSTSAFVTVFRQDFGSPPGRWLAGLGKALDPQRGLASPAASG